MQFTSVLYLFVFVKRQPAFPLRSASRRVSTLSSFTSFASLTSSNSLSSSCHRHVTKNPSQQPLQNQQLQTVTPATPLESAFTKTAGCLHQRFPFWNSPPRHTNLSRALSFHALTWNPFCNPFVLIFIHVMGGYPLPNLPTFKPSNVPTCSRAFPALPPVTSHAFIRTVTCPEGVHRTYYWNRRAFPPNFSQARVPLFPIA